MPTIINDIEIGGNVYFTLNDGVRDYKFHGRKGKVHDPSAVLFLIRKQEYPDANALASEAYQEAVYRNCQTLEEVEQWVLDNPNVDPLPWVSTHSKEADPLYVAKQTAADIELEQIAGMSYSQLSTYLSSNNITNTAEVKLSHVLLALLKKLDLSE